MRLFLAIDLNEGVRVRIADELAPLKPLAPKAKWTRVEQWHLTLVFLGEMDEAKLPLLRDVCEKVARTHAPFALCAQGSGRFGSPEHPTALWVSVLGDSGHLALLFRDLEANLVPLGHKPEPRAYQPHITLARSRNSAGDARLARCADALAEIHFGTLAVHEFVLFQSQLSREGSKYTKIATFRLGGGA